MDQDMCETIGKTLERKGQIRDGTLYVTKEQVMNDKLVVT
jgi:hypothetical protein